jgi:hypothetical protein
LHSIPFLHEEILLLEEEIVNDLYKLLSQFYSLPTYETYIYLSSLINNWKDDSFELLQFNNIIEKIVEDTNGNFSKVKYKEGYKILIKTISGDADLLNSCDAIPNMHNEFCKLNSLNKWDVLEKPLVKVMDSINYSISSTYIHEDFYFLDSVKAYTRENFKDDINKLNGDLITLLEKNDDKSLNVNSVRFNSLIASLLSFISLNKTTSTNIKFTDFFSKHYKLNVNDEKIEKPTVTINYDSSFKLLSRLFVKDLHLRNVEYIEGYITSLEIFINILYNNTELKKNLLDKLACFPNQNFKLKPQNYLKVDKVVDEVFKLKHEEITGKVIKDELLVSQFDNLISHSNVVTGIQLGDEIETKLASNKDFLSLLNNHNKIPVLLDLIKNISKANSKWASWLPSLNKVKEEVLMTKFKDETTRVSLFNILSVDSKEKINLLGELAQINDLKSLIKAGKEKQKEENRSKTHLGYINEIGIKIQNLVQNKLDKELAETIEIVESTTDERLMAIEEQNGQDFIIYKSGNPIYFIEVKSRWNSDGIVALSKRQVEQCAKNYDKYAVITVNVADYKSRNKVVDENISFNDLSQDVYVNTDLGENFRTLIRENQVFEKINDNTKLIEFRGHIPQDRIKNYSISFDVFIDELKKILLKNA